MKADQTPTICPRIQVEVVDYTPYTVRIKVELLPEDKLLQEDELNSAVDQYFDHNSLKWSNKS